MLAFLLRFIFSQALKDAILKEALADLSELKKLFDKLAPLLNKPSSLAYHKLNVYIQELFKSKNGQRLKQVEGEFNKLLSKFKNADIQKIISKTVSKHADKFISRTGVDPFLKETSFSQKEVQVFQKTTKVQDENVDISEGVEKKRKPDEVQKSVLKANLQSSWLQWGMFIPLLISNENKNTIGTLILKTKKSVKEYITPNVAIQIFENLVSSSHAGSQLHASGVWRFSGSKQERESFTKQRESQFKKRLENKRYWSNLTTLRPSTMIKKYTYYGKYESYGKYKK